MSNFVFRLFGWIARPLPTTGIPALLAFCDKVIAAYGLPKYESYREAICTMILHLQRHDNWGKPSVFAGAVRKMQLNESAYAYLAGQRQARKEADAASKPADPTPETDNAKGTEGKGAGDTEARSEQPVLSLVKPEVESGGGA